MNRPTAPGEIRGLCFWPPPLGEGVGGGGGSLGLGDAVIRRANEEMSMSKMTFPHQLARVILLEQLYCAMKIRAGERYHK